jgi:hypothetical protein
MASILSPGSIPGAVIPTVTQPVPVISSVLTQYIADDGQAVSSAIEEMEMPFEDELKSYVKADDDTFNDFVDDIKSMLTNCKNLNLSMVTLLLNPALYGTAYTSTLLTNLATALTADLAAGGTGLDSTWETAFLARQRARIQYEANRKQRHISTDIAKRVPYSGQVADALIEADRDAILALEDTNNKITEIQYEYGYKNRKETIQLGRDLEVLREMTAREAEERKLKAYIAYDEINVRQQWEYYKTYINRALDFARICVDVAKQVLGGADQITFDNYIQMSRIMAEGQLRIAALINNMMPGS